MPEKKIVFKKPSAKAEEKAEAEPVEEQPQEEVTIVVENLPQITTRQAVTEDEKAVHLVTRDEALSEMLQILREMQKAIVG